VLLEERLVRAAIARLQPGDLGALEQLQREFEQAIQASDRRRVRGANYRFHRTLYEIAQMSQSLHFVQVLWARYPFDLINQIEGRARRAAQEHRQLLDHLRAGDADQAARAIRLHIQEGWVELEAQLSETRREPRKRIRTTTQAAIADPEETRS
jgi:DNA-binding GntR family transcriptional regulator